MKFVTASLIILAGLSLAYAQGNEQAPIVEKEIAYKDWTYKSLRGDDELNLRKFTSGKRLVMVVYFAPWCPNWKHDAPFVQAMYEKYRSNGFDVVAVGEYEPLRSMKDLVKGQKVTFPVVWESDARTAKQTTLHYEYRKLAGDTRNWGSPWYIFLERDKLEPSGPVLVKSASLVNGELIRSDAERFIREKLGLPAERSVGAAKASELEVCDPEKKSTNLVKPN